MAAIIRQNQRMRQPQYPLAVSRKDIAAVWTPRLPDPVRKFNYNEIGFGRDYCLNAMALAFAASGDGLALTSSGGFSSIVPVSAPIWTLVQYVRNTITNAEWVFADYDITGAFAEIGIGLRCNVGATTAMLRVREGAGTTTELTIDGAGSANKTHTVVCGHVTSSSVFYAYNGLYTTTGTSVATRNAGTQARIGSAGNYNLQRFAGNISLFVVGNGVLSPAEAKSLSENPWQIFSPQPRYLFAPPAAVAGGFIPAWARTPSKFIGMGLR